MLRLITGRPGSSGFGSASTAEQVTHGIDGSNLTAIVTGGASGIGMETARVLAKRNVHVIIAARNMEAANEAKQRILKDNKAARVDVEKLDLSSIRSVKAFTDNFKALNLPLNILINNAGIMFCPFQLSEDGVEMQFATNHLDRRIHRVEPSKDARMLFTKLFEKRLNRSPEEELGQNLEEKQMKGHFYLTNLLLDKMKETAKSTGIQGRIVNLSSIAHICPYKEGIRFHKINDKSSYQDKLAYAQSKLANILHANELSRQLQEEGANITVNSVHPGLIMTPLMRHSALLMRILRAFTCFLWKIVPQGAATTCYVALHPSLKGVTGKYYLDCNEHKPSKIARDKALAKNLWDFSNNLVNAALKT